MGCECIAGNGAMAPRSCKPSIKGRIHHVSNMGDVKGDLLFTYAYKHGKNDDINKNARRVASRVHQTSAKILFAHAAFIYCSYVCMYITTYVSTSVCVYLIICVIHLFDVDVAPLSPNSISHALMFD
jgi:hypothetical protein